MILRCTSPHVKHEHAFAEVFGPDNPCPTCDNDRRKCKLTHSGTILCVGKVSAEDAEARGFRLLGPSSMPDFWMYRLADEEWIPRPRREPAEVEAERRARSAEEDAAKALKLKDWLDRVGGESAVRRRLDDDKRRWLSRHLFGNTSDLSPVVAEELRTRFLPSNGFGEDRPCWAWPMVNGANKVVGAHLRHPNKSKLFIGKCGVFAPDSLRYRSRTRQSIQWHQYSPLFVVEGVSDTLAFMAAGLKVIGRPSAFAGADDLAEWIRRNYPRREWQPVNGKPNLIVVGENDAKYDKQGKPIWAGRDGAMTIAHRVGELLGVPAMWSLPPREHKDSRDWLKGMCGQGKKTTRQAGLEMWSYLARAAEERGRIFHVGDGLVIPSVPIDALPYRPDLEAKASAELPDLDLDLAFLFRPSQKPDASPSGTTPEAPPAQPAPLPSCVAPVCAKGCDGASVVVVSMADTPAERRARRLLEQRAERDRQKAAEFDAALLAGLPESAYCDHPVITPPSPDQLRAAALIAPALDEARQAGRQLELSRPARACGCGTVPIFQAATHGERKARMRHPDCHCVGCDHCWTKKLIRWHEHAPIILAHIIPEEGITPETKVDKLDWRTAPVYRGVFDLGEWRKIRRSIATRAKRDGIRNPGTSMYRRSFATVYVVSEVPFPGANETTPAIALGEVNAVICELPRHLARGRKGRVRLVTHLGRWKMPRRVPEWKNVPLAVPPSSVTAIAAELGIDYESPRHSTHVDDRNFDGTKGTENDWLTFLDRIRGTQDADAPDLSRIAFMLAGRPIWPKPPPDLGDETPWG